MKCCMCENIYVEFPVKEDMKIDEIDVKFEG